MQECVSKVGSEATVGREWDERRLSQCACDDGEMCDVCSLKG